jgi:hypothetical protein
VGRVLVMILTFSFTRLQSFSAVCSSKYRIRVLLTCHRKRGQWHKNRRRHIVIITDQSYKNESANSYVKNTKKKKTFHGQLQCRLTLIERLLKAKEVRKEGIKTHERQIKKR